MLKVNVASLKELSAELTVMVTEYEELAMSIVQEINNAEFAWHDDNSPEFFEEAVKYKNKVISFISDIQKTSNNYAAIAETASKIKKDANSLMCNQNYRQRVGTAYSNAISSVNSLKNQLNSLSTYFCTWGERNAIRGEINRLSNIASNLGNSRTTVDNMFAKMSALENEINSKLSSFSYTKLGLLEAGKYMLR